MTEESASQQKVRLTLVPAAPPPVTDEGGRIAQSEMPFAIVEGEPITELPRDLYIPPHALEVFLEAFEGPLDLLLYLIRRQNIDILDIPIVEITRQYVKYIELMNEMQFELAGEYLLMAATLAEIKSRMLLPRSSEAEAEEESDPRADLVRRLLEYERYKQAAEDIDSLERLERDNIVASADASGLPTVTKLPDVTLKELLMVFQQVLQRSEMFARHHVQREALSVRERMSQVLVELEHERYRDFSELFDPEEGRMGVTVTFLAVLELVKEALIDIVQAEPFGPIHVRAAQAKANHNRLTEDSQEQSTN
jgi:segregation and condensation protein A